MSEETTPQPEATAEIAQQPAAVATARRRTPKQDATLAQAVELARQAVVDSAGAENVGEHLGLDVHEDRLLTHLFDCTMAGYPGWTWFATVARAPRTKLVTVCEVGLLAGEKSLLAPEWVPWEERMQAVNEQNEDERGEDEDTAPSESGDASEIGEVYESAEADQQPQDADSESSESGEASVSTGTLEASDSEAPSAIPDQATAADAHDQDEASS